MTGWRVKVAAVAVLASLSVPAMARAEEYPETAGWGALAVLANVGYMPAKTVYGVLGGLTGGFAYVFTAGNYETASNIWATSLGGTYVLTPSMIRGESPIVFAGDSSPPPTTGFDSLSEGSAPEPEPAVGRRGEEGLPAS